MLGFYNVQYCAIIKVLNQLNLGLNIMTRPIDNFDICTFDTETFNLNKGTNLIEIAALLSRGFDVNKSKGYKFVSKPSLDEIPSPYAMKVTGIMINEVMEGGLNKAETLYKIHKMFSSSPTGRPLVISGYNIKDFDIPQLHHNFFQNGLDPYKPFWSADNASNINNRVFDVYDLVKVAFALRPGVMEWATKDDGSFSLKLEDLSKANGIEHENAHESMSDVIATVKIAQIINENNPRLLDAVFEKTLKKNVRPFYKQALQDRTIMIDVNRLNGTNNRYGTLCAPIMLDPKQPDKIHLVDLRYDLQPLLELSVDEIRENIYKKSDDETKVKIGLMNRQNNKALHFNYMAGERPIISEEVLDAMNIDMDLVHRNYENIIKNPKALQTIKQNIISLQEDYGKCFDTFDENAVYSGMGVDNISKNGSYVSTEGFLDKTTAYTLSKATEPFLKVTEECEEGTYSEPLESLNVLEEASKCKDMYRAFQIMSRKKWLVLNDIPTDPEMISSATDAYEIKKVFQYLVNKLDSKDSKFQTFESFYAQLDEVYEAGELDERQTNALEETEKYVIALGEKLDAIESMIPVIDAKIETASEKDKEAIEKIELMEVANINKLYLQPEDSNELDDSPSP